MQFASLNYLLHVFLLHSVCLALKLYDSGLQQEACVINILENLPAFSSIGILCRDLAGWRSSSDDPLAILARTCRSLCLPSCCLTLQENGIQRQSTIHIHIHRKCPSLFKPVLFWSCGLTDMRQVGSSPLQSCKSELKDPFTFQQLPVNLLQAILSLLICNKMFLRILHHFCKYALPLQEQLTLSNLQALSVKSHKNVSSFHGNEHLCFDCTPIFQP